MRKKLTQINFILSANYENISPSANVNRISITYPTASIIENKSLKLAIWTRNLFFFQSNIQPEIKPTETLKNNLPSSIHKPTTSLYQYKAHNLSRYEHKLNHNNKAYQHVGNITNAVIKRSA